MSSNNLRPIDTLARLTREYRAGRLTEVETLYYLTEVQRIEESRAHAARVMARIQASLQRRVK